MRSPSQVCEEESSAKGTNNTVPYKCRTGTGHRRGGVQYACCEASLGDEMTMGGKKCTKEEVMSEEEEVLDATENEEEGSCEVDPSLSPWSRRHTMRSPSEVCEEESSTKGTNYTVPYKCRTGTGHRRDGVQYACCEAGLGDEMTSLGGKTCTKEEGTMSEEEEEEVLVAYD